MGLDARLLEIIACPRCKGQLSDDEEHGELVCQRCQLSYRVQEGIPHLLAAEATDLRGGVSGESGAVKLPRASFRVIEGPDRPLNFQIEQGTCRALGRGAIDPNKTAVFNVDIAFTLDESTKSLILKYVSRQFQRTSLGEMPGGERLGLFRRSSDIVMSDASLSRLHAMIFSDGEHVAILDLVSKNGTYVNGAEVESKMLSMGDIIEIGDTKIVFES